MGSGMAPEVPGGLFFEFIDQSPDVVWMFTPDWSEVRFVSSAYETIWGRSIEDLRADPADFLAGVHPEDRELVQEKMVELSAAEPIEAEYRVNESEDYERHVWVKGQPIYDQNGEFVAVAGFARDITEKRQLERELETILNQMEDAVFVYRPGEGFLTVNQTAVDRYGYGEQELLAMDPDDMMAGSGTPPSEHIDRILEQGSLVFEATHVTDDGTEIPVEINASTIQFQNDVAILAIVRDISDRRERARALQARNEQLEVLNQVVRHDIRNDMTVVMGWLERLEEGLDDDSDREIIERILHAGEHVIELTETARDLLEAVAGDGSIDPEPVAIDSTLETAVEIADDSYPDATISIDGEIPEVEVQGTELLGSVFHNLFANAVQHNDRADTEVTASVTASDAEVTIEVSDNGPGIPAGVRESMFQKGTRGLDSSSTGIGLFLVETLVDQIGGTVEVTENEPRGSVFVVTLPRAGVD